MIDMADIGSEKTPRNIVIGIGIVVLISWILSKFANRRVNDDA